jgi:hypothetical protein
MKYCTVKSSHLGRKKLHIIQGNNNGYLGAALVITCGALYAEDVFHSNQFVHIVHFVY